MFKDKNFTIIQLIKSGDIDINLEISNVKANKDIHFSLKQYLKKSPDFEKIKKQISDLEKIRIKGQGVNGKLEALYKIEKDFILNAFYLAKTFSTMQVRSDRLKKAVALFELGKIREADAILKESELVNDQIDLFIYAEYLENLINLKNNGK